MSSAPNGHPGAFAQSESTGGNVYASFLQHADALLAPHTSPSDRAESNAWLMRFATFPEAWQVADAVLKADTPPLSDSIVFLAAQIVNRKVRYDVEQLGADRQTLDASLLSLRDSIVRALARFKDRHAISTQLSLSLVAVAILNESWTGAIADLATGLGSLPGNNLSIMLEVLQYVPEEIEDVSLDVSAKRRFTFKVEMLNASGDVLNLLRRLLSDQEAMRDPRVRRRLVNCLSAWVRLSDISGPNLAESGLLELGCEMIESALVNNRPQQAGAAAAGGAASNQEFTAGVELMVEVVHRYHTTDGEDLPVVRVVVPRIFALHPHFAQDVEHVRGLVARTGGGVLNRNLSEVDRVVGLATVFGNLAGAYLPIVVGPQNMEQATIVRLALSVWSHPDFRVASKSLYFWFDLLDKLRQISKEELAQIHAAWGTVFEDLVDACVTRLVIRDEDIPIMEDFALKALVVHSNGESNGDDDDDAGDEDSSNDLIEDRNQTMNLLDKLYWAMPEELSPLPRIVSILERASHEATSPSSPDTIWKSIEAALLAFKALASRIQVCARETMEGHAVGVALSVALGSFGDHVAVRRAACDVIAELEYHIQAHANVYLSSVVSFLLVTLRTNQGLAAKEAGEAMRRLFSLPGNARALLPDVARLIQIAEPARLPEGVRLDVVEALCSVLAFSEPANAATAMQALSTLTDAPMEALYYANKGVPYATVVGALHLLGCVVRNLKRDEEEAQPRGWQQPDSEPCRSMTARILEGVIPSLETVLQSGFDLPPKDEAVYEDIVEAVSRFLKRAVRKWNVLVAPEVPRIMNFLVKGFLFRPASAYLYGLGVLLVAYASDYPSLAHEFPAALDQVVQRCLAPGLLDSPSAFMSNPDYVDDLFYVLKRAVECIPDKVLETQALEMAFALASGVGVLVEHFSAFRSVANFLQAALENGSLDDTARSGESETRNELIVNGMLERHGSTLMANLIAGCSGLLAAELVSDPMYRDGTATNVLFEVRQTRWGRANFERALHDSLLQPACAHLSNDLRAWITNELIKNGELSSMHRCMGDFAYRATRRQRRVV